jgi:hypothetical protein
MGCIADVPEILVVSILNAKCWACTVGIVMDTGYSPNLEGKRQYSSHPHGFITKKQEPHLYR